MYDYNYNYNYNDLGASSYETTTDIFGMIAVFSGAIWLISMVIAIVGIISQWKIYTKAGKPGWACLIPIYNIIVLLEIVELPIWYIALFFVPFANIYAIFKIYIELAHKFGKSTGFGVATVFFNFVCLPILAFSKNCVYNGMNNTNNTSTINNTQPIQSNNNQNYNINNNPNVEQPISFNPSMNTNMNTMTNNINSIQNINQTMPMNNIQNQTQEINMQPNNDMQQQPEFHYNKPLENEISNTTTYGNNMNAQPELPNTNQFEKQPEVPSVEQNIINNEILTQHQVQTPELTTPMTTTQNINNMSMPQPMPQNNNMTLNNMNSQTIPTTNSSTEINPLNNPTLTPNMNTQQPINVLPNMGSTITPNLENQNNQNM